MRHRSALALAILCSTIAMAVHAASPTSSSSSSSSSSSAATIPAWHQLRDARATQLRASAATDQKLISDWTSYLTSYSVKRSKHRSECRQDLRQANRDSKLPTVLRCYRGELSLEHELRRREREMIVGMPGVSDESRSEALKRSDLLLDAVNTLLNAIDSDVYATAEDLLKAKRKLASNYRDPFGAAMTRLRTDRLLSWTGLLIRDLSGSGTSVPTGTGGSMPLLTCLEDEERVLRELLGKQGDSSALRGSLQRLSGCTATPPVASLGASSTSSK